MVILSKNQEAVLQYLNKHSALMISPTEIGHNVGGGKRHSSWGSPICKKLVEMGLATRSKNGWYGINQNGVEWINSVTQH